MKEFPSKTLPKKSASPQPIKQEIKPKIDIEIKKKVNEGECAKKIEKLRNKMQKDLLDLLNNEQKAEVEREKMLRKVTPEEGQRLKKIFAIERAKEAEKITQIST